MGYIRKALEEGFSEMYGLGGGPQPYFPQKLAIIVDGLEFFLPVLVRFHTDCTAPPHYRVHFFFGLCPPHILGLGNSKNYVLEQVGTVAELCEGKIIKKMGKDVTVDRILPKTEKK